MTPIQMLGLLLAFAAIAMASYGGLTLGLPILKRRLAIAEEDNTDRLRDLFMPAESARMLSYLQFFGPIVLGFAVYWASKSPIFGLVAVVVGYFVHRLVFDYLKRRRKKRINDQLPDALNIMASSSRAGMNLSQVIQQVADSALPPIREEFGLIVSALQLGSSLEDALKRSRSRIGLTNYDLVVTSILINRERGGDITILLKRLADSLREIDRLEKKIDSETASMRFSAKLMAGMPVLFFVILYMMDPVSMSTLFTTLLGNLMLVAIVGLTVTGYTMIQKIANPDI